MTVEDRRVSVGVGISVSVAETSSLASYIITYKITYLPYLKKKKIVMQNSYIMATMGYGI